jgi:hypothetical protein
MRNLNSSSVEVTVVFNEKGNENYQLRLTELIPVSFRGVESKKTSADSVAPANIHNDDLDIQRVTARICMTSMIR